MSGAAESQEPLESGHGYGGSVLKQDYDIKTPNNERIFTEPGKKGEGDMKIFTVFPKIPWPHSLYYIGVCLRLKGIVEDRDYPVEKGYQGRGMLMSFCRQVLYSKKSIKELCEEYKIKLRKK
jgi:hypothetical protein